jgi:hypothetical protein
MPIQTNPPFFVTLIAGLMMAFAFQFLLTSFGIAAGVTALGYLPESTSDDPAESADESPVNVGFAVGFSTLLTVNTVLFLACFLAVKLSLVQSIVLGAIFGIVIWSAYFLLLIWLSVSAVGSVLGSVFGTIAAGMQGLTRTVARAFRKPEPNPETTELIAASTKAIRQEVNAALAGNNIRDTVQTYLQTLQPPQFDLAQLRQEMKQIVQEAIPQSPSTVALLAKVDRSALVNLLDDRTDFSKQEITQLLQTLDSVWQDIQQNPESELINFLATAKPDEITTDKLSTKLNQVKQANIDPGSGSQLNFKQLLRTVTSRVDLSDIDVEKILTQARSFFSSTQSNEPESFSTIRVDVEDYLLNSYPWNLTRKTVKQEFQDVIYDPEADPALIWQQLEPLDRAFFSNLLQQRDDLTPDKITKIVDRLEATHQAVLDQLEVAIAQTEATVFQQKVIQHLQSTKKSNLKQSALQRQFSKLLDHETNPEKLIDHVKQLDQATLLKALQTRTDLSEAEIKKVVSQCETVRDTLLAEIQNSEGDGKAAAIDLWQKLELYLSDPSKKLNVRNLKRSLNTFLKESQVSLAALRPHLPEFDRHAIIQLLSQRQDLSEKRIQQITEQLEQAWETLLTVPQKAVAKTKKNYEKLTVALTDYLQEADLSSLDADRLQHELPTLLALPAGASATWQLSQIDWHAVSQTLKTQTDRTEAEIDQAIAQVQSAVHHVGRAPRRLAVRSQSRLQDLQTQLADYLRNTDREELNPEGIRHDLKLLLSNPQTGLENLGERLAHFDRSTLTALLAQRGDFTEAEIEQVVHQIESVSQEVWQQIQSLQQQAQTTIATLFSKLNHYLASLQHPELNYESIQQDLLNLLQVPQAGVDELKHYLQELNQDTIATLVNVRDDLSATVSEQILDRIASVRSNLVEQAEQLQLEAQKQLEALKQQTQQKAEATRKAIATAAWWLFGTAFTSALTAATAGAMAVGGFNTFHWVSTITDRLRMVVGF